MTLAATCTDVTTVNGLAANVITAASIANAAIDNAKHQLITDLVADLDSKVAEIKIVKTLASNSTVIDIRHPDEVELKPLMLDGETQPGVLLNIPFYKLHYREDSFLTIFYN